MGVNKKLNQEDIKQYVTEDLESKISESKEAVKRLKFNHAVSTLGNPAEIRAKRRDIARLLTEKSKRKNETKG